MLRRPCLNLWGFVLSVGWQIRATGIAAADPSTQCVHAAVSRYVKLWSTVFGLINNGVIESVSSAELLPLPVETGLAHVTVVRAR